MSDFKLDPIRDRLDQLNDIPDLYYKPINYVFENNMVSDNGLWLEFGVYVGGTINRIAKFSKNSKIFGFDSFEGLPEDWYGRTDYTFSKGTFNMSGTLPKVDPNVNLIKGWFSDTLPIFIQKYNEPITFLHIDSDIYSSTKDIFRYLTPQISDGCIIVFDEMVGYPGFQFNEWKAWWEFVDENRILFEWIGGNKSNKIKEQAHQSGLIFDFDCPNKINVSPSYENVAVKIIKNPFWFKK